MRRKPFIMQGLCLGMMLFGMHGCFYHAFLPYTSLTKFMAALFLAAMWFTVLSVCPFRKLEQRAAKKLGIPWLKHPVADFLLLGTLVLLAAYMLHNIVRVQQDAQILAGALVHKYKCYYENLKTDFHPEQYVSNGSRLLFFIEILLSLYMANAFSRRNGMFLGTLPIAVLISAGLLLGESPAMWDMVCIACGVLGMQMATEGIRLGGQKGFRQRTAGNRQSYRIQFIAAVVLAVAFSVSGVLSVNTGDVYMQKEKELLEVQHKMERKVVDASVRAIQRIMMMLGIEQPGVMNNVAPSYTGKTVLTITTDKKPQNDLYLRGFIGTKYENGRWSNPAEGYLQELKPWNRYLLMTYDYYMVRRRAQTSGIPDDEIIKMKIEYAKGNQSSFGYLPYYSRFADDSAESFTLDGDYGIRRDSSVKEYWVNEPYIDYGTEEDFLSSTTLLRYGGTDYASEEDEDDVVHYCYYALQQDTWLPEEGLDRTKELAQNLLTEGMVSFTEGFGNESSPNTVIDQLRLFFLTSTTYSQDLKLKSTGQDYVENFLFNQRKGYCEHYATAGAVLLRAMGVAARYASGYKVSAQDFKDNGDGTYTADVIDSKAHAWTEVYAFGNGWTVADMTPPDRYQNMEPPRNASDMLSQTPEPEEDDFPGEGWESPERMPLEGEVTPTPEAVGEEEDWEEAGSDSDMTLPEKEGAAEESAADAGKVWEIFRWMALVLGICAVLACIWHLQIVLRYRRLKRCATHRQRILEMNRLLERYLRCCGHRGLSRMSDREYLEYLGGIYPEGRQKGVLEHYYGILEQARFAQEAGTREEISWCKKLSYRIGKQAMQECSGVRRFYVRWIRNWRLESE